MHPGRARAGHKPGAGLRGGGGHPLWGIHRGTWQHTKRAAGVLAPFDSGAAARDGVGGHALRGDPSQKGAAHGAAGLVRAEEGGAVAPGLLPLMGRQLAVQAGGA